INGLVLNGCVCILKRFPNPANSIDSVCLLKEASETYPADSVDSFCIEEVPESGTEDPIGSVCSSIRPPGPDIKDSRLRQKTGSVCISVEAPDPANSVEIPFR